MGPLFVLALASQQAQWLGLRQETIAGNIANANTPNYRPADLRPFSDMMDRTRMTMAATDPGHLDAGAHGLSGGTRTTSDGWETTASGNSVSLEQEMMKASDVHRAFALNTGIVKAFNRMILSSVKS